MTLMRLLCLPFAGAGQSAFVPWIAEAPVGLEIIPVPLAGRDRLLFERPHTDLYQAVQAINADIRPALAGEIPVVLFGHCLGALMAYELTRLLVRHGVQVAQLVVSGVPGPEHIRPEPIAGLPDAEFLERLVEVAGYQNAALNDPEMRELLLPTLRADVQMQESYRQRSRELLEVPVLAVRGAADQAVCAADIRQWRGVSSANFMYTELPGGHMYFLEQGPALLNLILTAAQRNLLTRSVN
jgi:surfactin synthase thioesterase subunit